MSQKKFEQDFYVIVAIPDISNVECSVLNYSNVTTTSIAITKNKCKYSTFIVRAVNCLGMGHGTTCAVKQGQCIVAHECIHAYIHTMHH